jgi:hypothetical protein
METDNGQLHGSPPTEAGIHEQYLGKGVAAPDLTMIKDFILGGFAQHLESGACQGGKETFIKIVEFVERRLELLRFRSMPLLLAGYLGK